MSRQVASFMSRIYLTIFFIPQNRLLIHVNGIEQYPVETIFKDNYESLTHGISWKEVNSHVHNRVFDHHHKLFVFQMDGTGHQIKM